MHAIRAFRTDSGTIELAPAPTRRFDWTTFIEQYEHAAIVFVEPLVGWGQYTALYRVTDPDGHTALYAVAP